MICFCNIRYLCKKNMKTSRSSEINLVTQAFVAEFGSLGKDALNWSPDANTWSIARNIDHLIVINSTYFPVFDAIMDGSHKPPFMSKLGFWVNWMGSFILKSVQPDRKKKIRTVAVWEPRTGDIDEGILGQFAGHQDKLYQYINELDGAQTVISSPASNFIVYTLDKALDIIIAHEKRHLEQAREVARLLKSVHP